MAQIFPFTHGKHLSFASFHQQSRKRQWLQHHNHYWCHWGRDFSLKLLSQLLKSRREKTWRPSFQPKPTAASFPTLFKRQLHRKKKLLNCGHTKEIKMKYYWIIVIAIEITQLRHFQNELGAKPQQEAVVIFLDSKYAVFGKEFNVFLAQQSTELNLQLICT